MIKLAKNVFISDDLMVRQSGALASLKQDVAVAAVRWDDTLRFESFADSDGLIFVAQYMIDGLEPNELNAIIAHEQGHIVLGHLEKHEGAKGIIDDMEIELEADAFACNQYGARTVRAALGKTLTTMLADFSAEYDISIEQRTAFYRNAVRGLKPRLSALRAAMRTN
jgi:Zn-dependent peptidase ImmA (M78 family)